MFALRANHAFDGEDFRPGGATVLLQNGRIVGVEPAAYQPPSDSELLDYGNATVLPGLIDTHVYLVGNSEVMALERAAGYSPEQIDEVVSESLRRHLAAGVTTVRDLGDRRFSVVQWRDAQRHVDDGLPWIVASGPPITTLGGHCGYLGGEVSGANEIVTAVRERVERQVDVVKVDIVATTDPSPSPAPLAEQWFKVLASETFEKRNLARQPGRVTGWSQHGGKGDIWWPGASFCSLCARYRFGRGCSHPWLCSSGADRSASVRVAFARSRCDSRDTWPEPSSGS